MDRDQLSLYSRRLAQENVEDILSALEVIQELPREDGELAVPELGAILKVSEAQGAARRNRGQFGGKFAVTYNCPTCLTRVVSMRSPGDDSPKVCNSCYGPFVKPPEKRRYLGFGEVCGAIMNIDEDTRPRV